MNAITKVAKPLGFLPNKTEKGFKNLSMNPSISVSVSLGDYSQNMLPVKVNNLELTQVVKPIIMTERLQS